MEYSFGFVVFFPSALVVIFCVRLSFYYRFYSAPFDGEDLCYFSRTFGAGELIIDILTIGLNVVEIQMGHQITPVESFLYKINLYLIPPAILCYIWSCTLIRPGEYEPIDGQIQEGVEEAVEEIELGEYSVIEENEE